MAAEAVTMLRVVGPGAKVPALATNRVLYRDGIAIASLVVGEVQWLEKLAPAESRAAEAALVRRQVGSPLLAYLR